MNVSLLHLDTKEIRKHKILDAYAIHKLVYTLFPKDGERDFIYRDFGMSDGGRNILIYSKRKPQNPTVGTLVSKQIDEKYIEHEEAFAFNVRINPTVKRAGKRVSVTTSEKSIAQWFVEKTEKWGFTVKDNVTVVDNGVQMFVKNDNQFIHADVTVTGVLNITDIQLFKHSLFNGIGSAKAFGFGLIQLIPIRKGNK